MKKLITDFQTTGICQVNVNKVIKAWTHKFAILKYHDNYKLYKKGRGQNCAKVEISELQAKQIIEALKLKEIKDSMLVHARTYKSIEAIDYEIERLQGLCDEKMREVSVLNEVIKAYIEAI